MKIRRIYLCSFYIATVLLAISTGVLFNSCKNKSATKSNSYEYTGNDIVDGKNLVQIHCTRCHALVQADALTKDVWVYHTMPAMASKFGLGDYGGNQYYQKDSAATISLSDWAKIIAYYKKAAPSVLAPAKPPVALQKDWAIFKLKRPKADTAIAYTTLVAADPYSKKIYTSGLLTRKLYQWDKNLKPTLINDLQTTAVGADFIKDNNGKTQGIFSSIGTVEDVDYFLGSVDKYNLNSSKPKLTDTVIANALPRPVNVTHGDFNKDGLTDYLVCCEGHSSGGLYLFTQTAKRTFNQTKIKAVAGAIQSVVVDYNHDGWPDIVALFGKGDEGIHLYLNDRKGGFSETVLLRFPPVYGSSSFQLVDFNHDGKPDILYTCGNNFGDSRILKPYHGLYIFTNQGSYKFKQSYFYPINGCTKAIAADFDHTGKLGIATIAFFADLKDNPAEGCIYFEPDGPVHFKPHAIPVNTYGRWRCMDINEHDGQTDIILGNYAHGFKIQDIQSTWDNYLPFIVLEGKVRRD